MKSDNNNTSNGSPIGNKSLHSQQHALLFPPTVQQQPQHGAGPRAVIPSKRAAQNRAAQRAFRQRKERYVKDLEKKAKLMDDWKIEIEKLRQENKELKENQMRLEKQIHQQHSQQYNDNDKPISPLTSPAMSVEVVPPPVVVVMNETTRRVKPSNNKRKIIKQESSPTTPPHKIQTTFLPVNLRAPDQTGYGSPTTSCSSSSSLAGLEEPQYQSQLSWHSSSSRDFDSYDTNLDFMSHGGGQVLDDLCSVLQTRQRPDINLSYPMQHQDTYSMSLNSPVSRQHDNGPLIMSRTH